MARDCFRVNVSAGTETAGRAEIQTRSPTKSMVSTVAPLSDNNSDSGVPKRAANLVHESLGFAE